MAGPQGNEDGLPGTRADTASGQAISRLASSTSLTGRAHRHSFSRVVPEHGKKRVNYAKGDARRIMEEAVSLCEAMTLGYEVVFHGRRRRSSGGGGGGANELGRCVSTLKACLGFPTPRAA